MMDRRGFLLTSLAGALVAPLAAWAQQPAKVFRIGILSNIPPTTPLGAQTWGAFVEGLRELGYTEGQNITLVHRSSEGEFQRLPGLAAELVRLKVDVIVAPASLNVEAAQQASRTIPIVMAGSADPVGAGLVASLARPGGNVTGLSMLSLDMVGKQLALLRESVPGVSKVAVLGNPAHEVYGRWLEEVKIVARSLGVQLQLLEARRPDDFESAFAAMTRERAGALLHSSSRELLRARGVSGPIPCS